MADESADAPLPRADALSMEADACKQVAATTADGDNPERPAADHDPATTPEPAEAAPASKTDATIVENESNKKNENQINGRYTGS